MSALGRGREERPRCNVQLVLDGHFNPPLKLLPCKHSPLSGNIPMRTPLPTGGNLRQRDLEVADPLFGDGAVRRRRLSCAGVPQAADHSLVAPDEE